jgi:hypothetical protein
MPDYGLNVSSHSIVAADTCLQALSGEKLATWIIAAEKIPQR